MLIRCSGWTLLFAVFPTQKLQSIWEYNESTGSAVALYGLASFVAYFAIFEWLHGTTLSKSIHKMRVVKADGAPCGPLTALVRSLMLLVDGLFFGIVAAISMASPLHQRLGDRLARTVVVAAALTVYLVVALCLFICTVLLMARAAPIDAGGASI